MDKRKLNRKIFKISDEEIKRLYLEGNSLNDIAKIAQDTKGLMALRNKLHDLGVDTTKNMKRYSLKMSKAFKKYDLNEYVFDVIDTEEKAYWLGFLYADGYNHENKTCVSLKLQYDDIEILEKFKSFLKTNAPIYKWTRTTKINKIKKEYCELSICSTYLSRQLAKLGCIQGKTYALKFPDFLDKTLYNHFLRGYFDGDGCISVKDRLNRRKRNGNCMNYQANITGRYEFIQECEKIISKNTNIPLGKIQKFKNNFAVSIHYSGKYQVTKLLNYLYNNATIYLQRKYDIYKEYCISAE